MGPSASASSGDRRSSLEPLRERLGAGVVEEKLFDLDEGVGVATVACGGEGFAVGDRQAPGADLGVEPFEAGEGPAEFQQSGPVGT